MCVSIKTSLWPAVALVLPVKNVGTGNGIVTLVLFGCGGLTSLVIGKMLDHFKRYVVSC